MDSNGLASDLATTGPGRGSLLANTVLFARLLRVGGLDIAPQRLAEWLSCLKWIPLQDRDSFKRASRALLVTRHEHEPWFDAAFDLFWQARDPNELASLELGLLVQKTKQKTNRLAGAPAGEGDEGLGDTQPLAIPAWSATERLRNRDFAELDADELREVRRIIDRFEWRLETRRSRRFVSNNSGRRLDVRRTLHRSLATGGEAIRLSRKDRKQKFRPLIVLCDVSGSMEPYSRILLRFLYAISRARHHTAGQIEAFAFGTKLTRLTGELRHHDVDTALSAAAARINDWGGGTRTGEALRQFNWRWARRVLGRGAAVLLISDGWDRGDVELLSREMQRLRRSCSRLIWLNPLLGSPNYRPLTRGMQASLPWIDDFLAVHSLGSLEDLGRHLTNLDRRPVRRTPAHQETNAI